MTCVILAVGGCRDRPGSPGPAELPPEHFGKLLRLRESPHPGLQEELARIVEEGGTPEQLGAGPREPDDSQNVAAGLRELFDGGRQAELVAGRCDPLLRWGQLRWTAEELADAEAFLARYAEARQRWLDALKRPESDLGIDFRAGFQADLTLVDTVRACSRLEMCHARLALTRDEPRQAVGSLACLLRLAACLAAEKHPTVRLEAAHLRAEALALFEAIVSHPGIDRSDLADLSRIVRDELDQWADDAGAWIGDRALGMWVYEVAREGRVLDILTPEEMVRFADEGILSSLADRVRQTANEDELYYLQTMRKVIDSCARPYYTRQDLFHAIREELQQRRNAADFPLIAGRLLLVDVEEGHRTQAQDRARWEAVALALAAATGSQPPPLRINPLTGKHYQVIHQEDRVMVWNTGDDHEGRDVPVVVPVPEPTTPRAPDRPP